MDSDAKCCKRSNKNKIKQSDKIIIITKKRNNKNEPNKNKEIYINC